MEILEKWKRLTEETAPLWNAKLYYWKKSLYYFLFTGWSSPILCLPRNKDHLPGITCQRHWGFWLSGYIHSLQGKISKTSNFLSHGYVQPFLWHSQLFLFIFSKKNKLFQLFFTARGKLKEYKYRNRLLKFLKIFLYISFESSP